MLRGILLFAALTLASAAPAATEELILLDVTLSFNDAELSRPRIALAPGSDGSVMQGLPGGLLLKLVFHSTHIDEQGTEMFIDMDFGREAAPVHVRAHRWTMAWGQVSETVFSTGGDDVVNVQITPRRVTRDELEAMAH